MNRIVLIGNGFDLAHNLKTRYEDFINWYWDYRVNGFSNNHTNESTDCLCTFECLLQETWFSFFFYLPQHFQKLTGKEVVQSIRKDPYRYKVKYSPFFENICKSIETKGWVDIENEYYHLLTEYALINSFKEEVKGLNEQLVYLKDLLAKYLEFINKQEVSIVESIKRKIYAPIKLDDISVASKSILKENVDSWVEENDIVVKEKIRRYGLNKKDFKTSLAYFRVNYKAGKIPFTDVPRQYLLPDAVMLLNFNYTHTAQLYYNADLGFINYIHGKTDDPQSIIFGYGDELDDDYKKLQKLNDNECLTNVKTIKYQESDNYRKLLAFAESAPYQVCIMGHSCGNSDRTLLNTLFEHKNCISIKPYYYIKEDGTDNYLELIQNISRNFTDMKLMRDRVVNKTYCEPLLK